MGQLGRTIPGTTKLYLFKDCWGHATCQQDPESARDRRRHCQPRIDKRSPGHACNLTKVVRIELDGDVRGPAPESRIIQEYVQQRFSRIQSLNTYCETVGVMRL